LEARKTNAVSITGITGEECSSARQDRWPIIHLCNKIAKLLAIPWTFTLAKGLRDNNSRKERDADGTW